MVDPDIVLSYETLPISQNGMSLIDPIWSNTVALIGEDLCIQGGNQILRGRIGSLQPAMLRHWRVAWCTYGFQISTCNNVPIRTLIIFDRYDIAKSTSLWQKYNSSWHSAKIIRAALLQQLTCLNPLVLTWSPVAVCIEPSSWVDPKPQFMVTKTSMDWWGKSKLPKQLSMGLVLPYFSSKFHTLSWFLRFFPFCLWSLVLIVHVAHPTGQTQRSLPVVYHDISPVPIRWSTVGRWVIWMIFHPSNCRDIMIHLPRFHYLA